MPPLPQNPLASPINVLPLEPTPPDWVYRLFSQPRRRTSAADDAGDGVPRVLTAGSYALISSSAREPANATAEELAETAASVYRAIGDELRAHQRHPVRIWNFVPDIQGAISGAGDRYMAFNLGRFSAYCDWFGGPGAFRTTLPTSSAVGVTRREISVHVLAAQAPGVPVENPRQVPAYKYSRRYGRRPPCFARATRVGSRLLIGGTASILGEDSCHTGDFDAQAAETFQNLSALVAAAHLPPSGSLSALSSLRVHVRDLSDGPAAQEALDRFVPGLREVEIVQAPLCRQELLVEIEGVAQC